MECLLSILAPLKMQAYRGLACVLTTKDHPRLMPPLIPPRTMSAEEHRLSVLRIASAIIIVFQIAKNFMYVEIRNGIAKQDLALQVMGIPIMAMVATIVVVVEQVQVPILMSAVEVVVMAVVQRQFPV